MNNALFKMCKVLIMSKLVAKGFQKILKIYCSNAKNNYRSQK